MSDRLEDMACEVGHILAKHKRARTVDEHRELCREIARHFEPLYDALEAVLAEYREIMDWCALGLGETDSAGRRPSREVERMGQAALAKARGEGDE